MARIEGYRFGRVLVDGEEQTKDVIVLPERVLTNWWRAEGHGLVLADLEEVLEELRRTWSSGRGRTAGSVPTRRRSTSYESEVSRSRRCRRKKRCGATEKLDPGRTAAALHLTC